MNSITYEYLNDTCKLLSNLLIKKKVVNRIANNEKGTTMMEPVIKTYAEVKAVSELINKQFQDLRSAFTRKKIALGEYRLRLTPLRDLLTKHKARNEHLNTEAIKKEVDLYFKK